MNLYLVQHGAAKSREEDPDRALSKEGEVDVIRIASYVASKKLLQLRAIVHSGKTRAGQTAEILNDALKPSEGIKAVKGLNPMDDPSIWAHTVRSEEGDIMLVGHLPHLSRLTSLLLCGDTEREIIKFQNAGITCLSSNETDAWSLRWVLTPEMIV